MGSLSHSPTSVRFSLCAVSCDEQKVFIKMATTGISARASVASAANSSLEVLWKVDSNTIISGTTMKSVAITTALEV